MMKATGFIAGSIALTLVFYMAAYYLEVPVSAPMMALFAAVAMLIVWAFITAFRKAAARKSGPTNAAGNKPQA